MSELVEATTHGLSRVQALVTALTAESLSRVFGKGWTVAATLAHLAFWDRWVEARWHHFTRVGSFHDLPDDVTDWINEAAMGGWLALSAPETMRLCLDAAMRVTHSIERLSPQHIAAAVATGRVAMVNRTLHWYPHLDEIERVVR